MNNEEKNLPDCTVAELALGFPQSLKILRLYELDYCCEGKKPFREACTQHHLDALSVWHQIQKELPIPAGNQAQRFDRWDLPLLLDFIIQNHHEYLRIALPQLMELIEKVTLIHGPEFSELTEIQHHVSLLAEELLDHMPKEEEIIFPAIRRLATSPLSSSQSPLLANTCMSISVLEREHYNITDAIKLLRSLTNQYQPPQNACPTFQITYRLLEELDDDLVQHIHLENNIVFPKVKFQI
jgi:regulator of cell morphogenesis and NO signaling